MDIVLKHISKSFGKVSVLNDLSLSFEDGTLTTILGPSGCGKTTILNLISGVLSPDAGQIFFGADCVNHIPMANRRIGYVFQNYSLYPNMTAYENIKFPLTCQPSRGMCRKERKQFFDSEIRFMARLLQIEDILKRYPSEMSGGQQQRVAIARAIVRKPNILLMDEPFANLDRRLSVQLREDVRELQHNTGITTIFVTHNQSDANAISNRIVLMNKGSVQQQGAADTLWKRPANLFTADFFGDYASNILSAAQASALLPSIMVHAPAETAYVSFRPEDASPTGENGPFCISSVTHVGVSWLCRLKTEEKPLLAFSTQPQVEGRSVSLTVDPADVVFYDATERRIDSHG